MVEDDSTTEKTDFNTKKKSHLSQQTAKRKSKQLLLNQIYLKTSNHCFVEGLVNIIAPCSPPRKSSMISQIRVFFSLWDESKYVIGTKFLKKHSKKCVVQIHTVRKNPSTTKTKGSSLKTLHSGIM